MTDSLNSFIVSLVMGILGILVGILIEGGSWRSDCTKINAHVSENKVFKCEEKK